MRIIFDPRTDTLTMELRPGPVAESDEHRPGVVLDYDAEGNLLGFEILDASKHIQEPRCVDFQVAG